MDAGITIDGQFPRGPAFRTPACTWQSIACYGFTLMELLISITVLTILVGLIYGSFASITNTMNIARDNADLLRYRQVVWRSLTTNLQAVYADSACLQPDYQFLGETKNGAYGSADSLRFVAALPMPGSQSLPGVIKVVSYTLSDYAAVSPELLAGMTLDDDRPGGVLVIREEPLQLESSDFVTRAGDPKWAVYERAVPVASIKIQYYDQVQNEWREEWDSTTEQRLPGGVWFQINFPRTREEREEELRQGINALEHPDLEYITFLPLGRGVELPFPDFNHMRFEDVQIGEP